MYGYGPKHAYMALEYHKMRILCRQLLFKLLYYWERPHATSTFLALFHRDSLKHYWELTCFYTGNRNRYGLVIEGRCSIEYLTNWLSIQITLLSHITSSSRKGCVKRLVYSVAQINVLSVLRTIFFLASFLPSFLECCHPQTSFDYCQNMSASVQ